MKQKFLIQSIRAKQLLQKRLSKEQLANDYIYNQIDKLVSEVELNRFTSVKTDIGQAAIKIFDSGSPEDNELCEAISDLAETYRRIQKK